MGVTDEKGRGGKPGSGNGALKLLVDFLNLDFNADIEKRSKKTRRLETLLGQFVDMNEARKLQMEIGGDLLPIASWYAIPETLYPAEERWLDLVYKLNKMNFQRRFSLREKEGRPIIKGWNYAADERENWYAGIASLLEDGEIQKLRQCPQCHIFFIARDQRQRFCNEPCKTRYHNKLSGKFRAKMSRAKRALEARNIEEDRQEHEAIQRFNNFINLAIMRHQDTTYVGPIVKKIGQGDSSTGWKMIQAWEDQLNRGIIVKDIWENTTETIKEHFRSKK